MKQGEKEIKRTVPGPKFLTLFFASLALNIFFFSHYLLSLPPSGRLSSPEPGWSRTAAAEAEAVAALTCSGHGRAFIDGVLDQDGFPTCECHTCYSGADCSELVAGCSADADSGDPLFLEPYWRQHAAESAVLVSGWHRMSYATTDGFMSLELEKHIRLLHAAVGNAITDDKFIVFGSGSTQLINALVYALSPDNASSPASVVATVPYYPMYKLQTNLFDGREYEWKGVTSKWMNSTNDKHFIEFVTSPNNPDSLLYKSVLSGSHAIHDHAYYWPHLSAIPAPADEDVMLFSCSKTTGHASSRFGWALIRDENVYTRVSTYIQANSFGVSRDAQLRILKLVKVMLAQIGGDQDIFKFGYNTLRKRWSRLHALVNSTTRFSLQPISPQYCTYFETVRDPSPAYAWLKCEWEQDQDCYTVLLNGGLISRSGTSFEASSRYTRLSLIKTQDDFEMLLQKMESLVSSKENDNSPALNRIGSI